MSETINNESSSIPAKNRGCQPTNEWPVRKEMDFQKIDTELTKSLTLDEELVKVEAMRAQLLQLKEQQTQAEVLTIDAK